jgi:hypothetical protein
MQERQFGVATKMSSGVEGQNQKVDIKNGGKTPKTPNDGKGGKNPKH